MNKISAVKQGPTEIREIGVKYLRLYVKMLPVFILRTKAIKKLSPFCHPSQIFTPPRISSAILRTKAPQWHLAGLLLFYVLHLRPLWTYFLVAFNSLAITQGYTAVKGLMFGLTAVCKCLLCIWQTHKAMICKSQHLRPQWYAAVQRACSNNHQQ